MRHSPLKSWLSLQQVPIGPKALWPLAVERPDSCMPGFPDPDDLGNIVSHLRARRDIELFKANKTQHYSL